MVVSSLFSNSFTTQLISQKRMEIKIIEQNHNKMKAFCECVDLNHVEQEEQKTEGEDDLLITSPACIHCGHCVAKSSAFRQKLVF